MIGCPFHVKRVASGRVPSFHVKHRSSQGWSEWGSPGCGPCHLAVGCRSSALPQSLHVADQGYRSRTPTLCRPQTSRLPTGASCREWSQPDVERHWPQLPRWGRVRSAWRGRLRRFRGTGHGTRCSGSERLVRAAVRIRTGRRRHATPPLPGELRSVRGGLQGLPWLSGRCGPVSREVARSGHSSSTPTVEERGSWCPRPPPAPMRLRNRRWLSGGPLHRTELGGRTAATTRRRLPRHRRSRG